jgi:branched-chain amino acid transport system permease protein
MEKAGLQRGYYIIIAVMVLLPLVLGGLKAGNFYLHVLIMLGIFTILGSGINLLMGFTGQASIGHAAFFGIGAYVSTLLMIKLNFPFWAALPLAGAAGAVSGLLIGYPSLRLKGISFAIVTFAFGELVKMVFVNWKSLTNGQDGLTDIPSPALWGINFAAKLPYTYLVMIFTLFALFLVDRIVNSRVGKAFISIREDEDLAASTGVNVMQYKILSFVISTFLAGIAGSLYAHYMHFINPADFTVAISMTLIAIVVIGGLGTIIGPIFGSLVLLFMPEVLRPVKDYYYLIFGIILIVVMIFAPVGIMGGLQALSRKKASGRTEAVSEGKAS